MEIALKVNIDFEEVLFRHEPHPHLNESLEYLALWVDSRPLLTKKKYSSEYLEYIQEHTGIPPRFKSEGKHVFWWGDLSNPELLKTIAQKSFCFKFFEQSWKLEGICPQSWIDVKTYLVKHQKCVLKGEGKMSGRGHKILSLEDIPSYALKPFESCVLEPLYERMKDISALWVNDEVKYVYYENEIDQKFQWRANLIRRDLEVDPKWSADLMTLQKKISDMGYLGPYSVDAFYYKVNEKVLFYPGSEVNPRKTMGWINYKMGMNFKKKVSLLTREVIKLSPEKWSELSLSKDILLLSPPENKFLIFWVGADNEIELNQKKERFLKQLLRP